MRTSARAGLTAVVLLAAASAAGRQGHHHGSYTPASWARAFLAEAGLPRTRCNLAAVRAWEAAEGGHWHNTAAFNPLNTTMREPGSRPINSVGVQAYTSWAQGLAASAATLNNGLYSVTVASFRAGDDARATANAVAASPWGTRSLGASC